MERNPKPYLQDSFAIDNETVEDVKGQIGNAELVDHSRRLVKKLWNVAELSLKVFGVSLEMVYQTKHLLKDLKV